MKLFSCVFMFDNDKEISDLIFGYLYIKFLMMHVIISYGTLLPLRLR